MFDEFRAEVRQELRWRKLLYKDLAEMAYVSESCIKSFLCGANDSRRTAESISDAFGWEMIYSDGKYRAREKE